MRRFNYCISNPPYQITVRKAARGVADTSNIFPKFQITGNLIARRIIMIYPGGRWMKQSGKNCKKFGEQFINDPHLEIIKYYNGKDTKYIFPTVNIGDGLSIVIYDNNYHSDYFTLNGVRTMKPGNGILPLCDEIMLHIINKLFPKYDTFNKHNYTYMKPIFNDVPADEQVSFPIIGDTPPKVLKNPIKALINNTRGIFGRTSLYWIENSVEKNKEYVNYFKVAINSNIQGNEKYTSWRFQKLDNNTIAGPSRIIIAYFSTSAEADNFIRYMDTVLMRRLLSAAGGSRDRMGHKIMSFIPDIKDYSNNNPIFMPDDKLLVDHQYYQLTLAERMAKLFELDQEEMSVLSSSN